MAQPDIHTDLGGLVAYISDVGKVRTNQQDYLISHASNGVFVIGDGIGGAREGDVASRMAVEHIATGLNNYASTIQRQLMTPALQASILQYMNIVCQEANNIVYQYFRQKRREGGTTLTCALVHEDDAQQRRLFYAHAGDSRLYIALYTHIQRLAIDGKAKGGAMLRQVTQDHSKYIDGFGSIVYRAIGLDPNVTFQQGVMEIDPIDDGFLLTTDGLTTHVSDKRIEKILGKKSWKLNAAAGTIQQNAKPPKSIIRQLFDKAIADGGTDNITMLYYRFPPATLEQIKSL